VNVRLSTAQPVIQGDVDVTVHMTVTNTCRQPVQLLGWHLPSDRLSGALFTVTRDGAAVRYAGPIVKRSTPTSRDQVTLGGGESLDYDVELTAQYDLSQNGMYTVSYSGKVGGADSAPVHLWLNGRSATASAANAVEPAPTARAAAVAAASLSYTGNCSSTQKTSLASAVAAATHYSSGALSYLNGTPGATQRYTKWFGAYTSTRWNTAKTHYSKALSAFQTQALTLDCSCKDSGTYAYVYPTQPYKIYVCGAFWNAPMTGTDSKGGTLVHEMMHFNVVASTDDWAYGQTAAAQLAASNPTKALDNSDNHEYFAENSPPLP
jgi:peptidyl-Lys metalloendopeptidase